MVTLGTGIGGGIIADGRVYRSAHGRGRDRPRHRGARRVALRLRRLGHWEAIASGNALGRMARDLVASGRGDGILAAACGDVRDVGGGRVAVAAAAGDAGAAALLALRRQRRDRARQPRQHLRSRADRDLGGLVEMGVLLLEPLAKASHSGSKAPSTGTSRSSRPRSASGPAPWVRRSSPGRPSSDEARSRAPVVRERPGAADQCRPPRRGPVSTVSSSTTTSGATFPLPRRPALECFALLGAIAADTGTSGSARSSRASLRPPATLAHSLDTVQARQRWPLDRRHRRR